ncbi:MAG TPA: SusE domain-containing protein, partial [Ferruginibacter sp.]|nr:SusE domain-containing protein [Ferruginibacter sp.]
MKKAIKLFLAITFSAGLLVSCKKDENKVYFEGGTPPLLTASSTTPMVLKRDDKDKFAITFSWTNPNYHFNTGVSSQSVTYILQVDTTGANFGSSKLQEQSISSDLSITMTVRDVNLFL